MKDSLGTIKQLDVHQIWKNEAADFTPWLAEEENIALLGNVLGIELEVENTEVAAGPYSADILARDTGTSGYVVIENQLGRTNHDHLGKAITYAAVLNANTIVWIAPEFTDEHKKALDWLNDNSSDELAFFGVRPELWQIDESKPAVQFNVLSRPAETIPPPPRKMPLSPAKKLQLEWWTVVRDALVESKALPSVQTPRPQYWYDVALGRTGIFLSNTANTFDHKIGVRVYMSEKYGGHAALAQLLDSKEEIESELGTTLLWDANPDRRDKIIAVYCDADISKRDKWPEYCEWMVDMITRFRTVFRPRIKELDLDMSEEDDATSEE